MAVFHYSKNAPADAFTPDPPTPTDPPVMRDTSTPKMGEGGESWVKLPADSRPADPPPAAEPEPETVWDRIGAIFRKKKLDARQTYVKLLLFVERDGGRLTPKQDAEFAMAIEAAHITSAEIQEHRGLIARRASHKITADLLPSIQQEVDSKAEQAAALTHQIDTLIAKRDPLTRRLSDLATDQATAKRSVHEVEFCDAKLAQLFGES